MLKADYGKIANFYDRARPLRERNIELWMDLIRSNVNATPGARALDLGCGTGRFALPMAVQLNFNVTGLDSSPDMLGKARAKDRDGRINWEIGDAGGFDFGESSFELVFMSHLLHHVDDPLRVLGNCYRALCGGGSVMVRYGAIEQIRKDPEHTFFPETVPLDEARTPSIVKVEAWLKETGFLGVKSLVIAQKTYETSDDRLRATSLKSNSVLNLISDDAFEAGLRKLKEYIKSEPADPWLLHDSMTLSIGYKPPYE